MLHNSFTPRKKAGKRILAFLLACGIALTGCGLDALNSTLASGQWIDSDIIGAVNADDEFRPQDDYCAYYVKENLLGTESSGAMSDCAIRVMKKKRDLLGNESVQGKEIGEVRKFVELLEDSDYRNRLGVEPLRKYIDSIEAISDLSALYEWMCDPNENPLGTAPLEIGMVFMSLADPTVYMTYLQHPVLSLGTDASVYFSMTSNVIEAKVANDEIITYVLSRLGRDESLINEIILGNAKIEKLIAANETGGTGGSQTDVTYTREDLGKAAESYPLLAYLDARGYSKTQRFNVDMGYLRQLGSICRESNLPSLKAFLTVQYIMAACKYLDEETIEEVNRARTSRVAKAPEGSGLEQGSKEDRLLFRTYIPENNVLQAALDKSYVDEYVDASCHDRIYKMTEKIIDVYHDIFNGEEWMSEEGRARCIEKLDEIKIHVIYPGNDVDFSRLNIKGREDGGSLFEARLECIRLYHQVLAERSVKAYDRDFWDPLYSSLSTTETNAAYAPMFNGIFIYAGIIEEPLYYSGISDEELLGTLGAIIGHEITHGFDAGGSRYDKDGVENSWLSEDDKMAFNDRSDKVGKYYSTMKTYPGAGLYGGGKVLEEATADMGGIKAVLKIAEEMPGFDYDKFFKAYARNFACQRPRWEEEYYFKSDSHPLGFLRVNVGLQQFDEFYETYDVGPSDGMYLEEEKRIKVW